MCASAQPEHTGLGWDFAGTVLAAGRDVDLAVGTRVAGLVAGFDRDFGTYAEQLVVAVTDLAVVPDGLDRVAASTVPLNGLAAAQIVDLLGDAPTEGNRLLVTGAVGAYVAALTPDRGWRVTGLARAEDEQFIRGLGAEFTTHAEPGWDAVADGAVLQERGLALVRDGGIFVGVRPNAVRVVRTAFICDYLSDADMRKEIGEGLQVVENWNSANSDLCYGKDGDLTGADKESQEVAMLALHLLQSSLVHVNTLLVQQVWRIRSGRTRSPRRTGGGCRRCSGPM